MPTPRAEAAGTVVGSTIYVFGGYNRVQTGPLTSVEALDTTTMTWSTKAAMPTARFGLEAAFLNDRIYVMGGTWTPNAGTIVEIYDPKTDTWSAGETMPGPKAAFAIGSLSTCGAVPNIIIATAGVYDSGGGPQWSHETFGFSAVIGFSGFLAPVGGADLTGGSFANPLRTFKMGSTIPVKFTAACSSTAVLTGSHTLQAAKYSDATTSATAIDATPPGEASSGDLFSQAGGQWQFNLDTKATGMSVGTWMLIATLSDGSQHVAWIQLK